MRFNAQQENDSKVNSLTVQESVISQQAKLLPVSPNSIIPGDWLKSKPSHGENCRLHNRLKMAEILDCRTGIPRQLYRGKNT